MKEATSEAVRKNLKTLMSLSTLPVVISRLFKVIQNERSTVEDLAEVIRHDQSLAARVVGVANSPFLGYPHKITSIEQAIFVLGFDLIKSLAMSLSIFSLIPPHYSILKRLWAHSYGVATLSALIAHRIPLAERGASFLSGLLHDIGRVLLFTIYRSEYANLLERGRGVTEEIESFECSHAEVARWFLEPLGIPEAIILPVSCHHAMEALGDDGQLKAAVTTVYLAEGLSSSVDCPFAFDGLWTVEHAKISEAVGLTEKDLIELERALQNMKDPTMEFFAMQ